MNENLQLWPDVASRGAVKVDTFMVSMLAMTLFFTTLICLLIFLFVIRYRFTATVNRKMTESVILHSAIEVGWMAVPLFILLGFFAVGTRQYVSEHQPPSNALEVLVVGKQWMWKLAHESGKREINTLHVPVGQPVRLRMTSEDVIHSFFIPAFRVKQDVLPGRYTSMWFEPTKPGRYHLFCAEYCGTKHSAMIGEVVAMSPEAYAAWAATDVIPPAQRGRRIYDQLGCAQCHGEDGGRLGVLGDEGGGHVTPNAPSLVGLWNRQEQLADGRRTPVDAEYLRRAILEPQTEIVAGYKPQMPTFQGEIDAAELDDLIAYIQSLSSDPQSAAEETPMATPQPEETR